MKPRTNLTARQLAALRVVFGGNGRPPRQYRHALAALRARGFIALWPPVGSDEKKPTWVITLLGLAYMQGRWDADAMRGGK